MKLTVLDGQTLLDIQLIGAGSMEGVMDLCALNDLPLTADMEDGQQVECGEVVASNVVASYANRRLSPATAIDPRSAHILGGIGYMRVEVDFIVS